MEAVAKKIVMGLTKNTDRSEIQIMKMQLGVEVFLHDFLMISSILIVAFIFGMFRDACIMFIAFGIFRVLAGGIHVDNSLGCLLSTGVVIIGGVKITEIVKFDRWILILLYIVLIILTALWAPRGTENNPFSVEDSKKMKRYSIILVAVYAVISYFSKGNLRGLLTMATIFEVLTLIPIRHRKKKD